jgi:transposase
VLGKGFWPVRCAGVEGTSSYGAGLARHLRAKGIEVLEVERPKHRRRSSRSNVEKSDPSDAERAARERCWPEKRRACPRAPTGA